MSSDSRPRSDRGRENEALARLTRALLFEDASKGSLNLAAVARESGVSRSFLYQNQRARALIERARSRGGELQQSRASIEVASWRQRSMNAEARVQELSNQILSMRQQLQTLLVAQDKDVSSGGIDIELVRTADQLKAELAQANEHLKRMADQLEASRDNVRFLSGRLEELEKRELGRLRFFSSSDARPEV